MKALHRNGSLGRDLVGLMNPDLSSAGACLTKALVRSRVRYIPYLYPPQSGSPFEKLGSRTAHVVYWMYLFSVIALQVVPLR